MLYHQHAIVGNALERMRDYDSVLVCGSRAALVFHQNRVREHSAPNGRHPEEVDWSNLSRFQHAGLGCGKDER